MHRSLKIGFWILGALLFLLVLLALAIQIPVLQTKVTSLMTQRLSSTLQTRVKIDRVRIHFFTSLELHGIYLEDRTGDTLLYADRIHLTLDKLSLWNKQLKLNQAAIEGMRINFVGSDSTSNYAFLRHALEGSDGSGGEWEILLGEFTLMDGRFAKRDNASGRDIRVLVGSCKTDLSSTNLQEKRALINGLDLDQLRVEIRESKMRGNRTHEAAQNRSFSMPKTDWQVALSDLIVTQSALKLQIGSEKASAGFDPKHLNLEEIAIYLNQALWEGDELFAELESASFKDSDQFYLQQMTAQIHVDSNAINWQNLVMLTPKSRLTNTSSLEFAGDSDGNDIQYQSEFGRTQFHNRDLTYFRQYLGKILPFLNIDGVNMLTISGRVMGNSKFASLKDFAIDAGGLLSGKIDARISEFDRGINGMSADINRLNIATSQDGFSRLTGLSWSPSLAQFGRIEIDAVAQGTIRNLKFDQLHLTTEANTEILLKGHLQHLNQREKLEAHLDLQVLKTNADDFADIIPDSLYDRLAILGDINYQGLLSGTLHEVHLEGKGDTDMGCFDSDLTVAFNRDYSSGKYNGVLVLERFQSGQLINSNELDWIYAKLQGYGSGFGLDDLAMNLDLQIDSMQYAGYTYRDLHFDGEIRNKSVKGKARSNDSRMEFDFSGLLDLRESSPSYSFDMMIERADLLATNFTNRKFDLQGRIKADGSGRNLDEVIGSISIDGLMIHTDSFDYESELLVLDSRQHLDRRNLNIQSDDISLEIEGDFRIAELIPAAEQLLGSYFTPVPVDSSHWESVLFNQDFTFSLSMTDGKSLSIFLPQLQSLDSVELSGLAFSDKQIIQLTGMVNRLDYGDYRIDSLTFGLSADGEQLDFALQSNGLSIRQIAEYPHLQLASSVMHDSVLWELTGSSNDSLANDIQLTGLLTTREDLYRLQMLDKIEAGGYTWSIATGNEIFFKPGFIRVNNLELQHRDQRIHIHSREEGVGTQPIQITFEDFELQAITDLAGLQGGQFGGSITGSLEVFDLFEEVYYRADMKVNSFVLRDSLMGDLSINAIQSPQTSKIRIKASLVGDENNLNMDGTYDPASAIVSASIRIDQAEMQLLDPFLEGILRDNQGTWSGLLEVGGEVKSLNIAGQVNLKNVRTTIEINGSQYTIPDHSILIDGNAIDLASMTIMDDNGYEAVIEGKIYHNLMRDFVLDLKLSTEQFQFLNTSTKDNPAFYGKLMLRAEVIAKGPIKQPDVEVHARTLNGSIFTLSSFVESREVNGPDFILFGRPDSLYAASIASQVYQVSNSFPFDATITLEATEEAQFIFIVDPESGDHLMCRGTADLILEFKPSGHISLYGQYNVSSGSYFFSYADLIKRSFILQQGSTVTFTGDPLNAVFDLKAKYTTQTAVYDLIRNEASLSEDDIKAAQGRQVVDVIMDISGPLSSPQIEFDIQLPEQRGGLINSAVNRKLEGIRRNPDELNQQVFSILLFRSFMTTDRSGSIASSLGEGAVLSSMSRLFTDQLNRLAEKYVKGIEVSIDIEAYKSEFLNEGAGGTTTEVGVGVSKRLFNDRFTISAASSFDVNSTRDQTGFSTIAGDFLLEYRLSESGNYVLKVFRRSDYDVIDETNTSLNGVSISYQKSFSGKKKTKKK